jgi:hypothetical protein
MRVTISRAGAIALALTISLVATAAFAQPLPVENHYKVYNNPPIPIVKPVGLRDQFGTFNVDQLSFERFATPATKIHSDGTVYPMVNPDIHMDWWRIFYPQPVRTVLGTDQFGQAPWTLGDARYLLVPSLKNVPPPQTVPPWNHYVCYDALSGPLINKPVTLIDQFGNVQVVVLQAKYFCNPVEKFADGQIYPILDPNAHLACYQVDNPSPDVKPITTIDQFGYWQTQINHNDCLCVPALKDYPLATEKTTWGQIKALYRN